MRLFSVLLALALTPTIIHAQGEEPPIEDELPDIPEDPSENSCDIHCEYGELSVPDDRCTPGYLCPVDAFYVCTDDLVYTWTNVECDLEDPENPNPNTCDIVCTYGHLEDENNTCAEGYTCPVEDFEVVCLDEDVHDWENVSCEEVQSE